MSTDRERLLDFIEHLALIERHRPESEDALEADEVLAAAMIRWIEVVGEAASHVSHEMRNRAPEIPWRAIVAMRNRLIHAYPQVSLSLVWGVIVRDGPAMRKGSGRWWTTDSARGPDLNDNGERARVLIRTP